MPMARPLTRFSFKSGFLITIKHSQSKCREDAVFPAFLCYLVANRDIIYKIILDKANASRYDDINPKQKTVCGIIPNKALNAKTIKDAQMRSCFCSLFSLIREIRIN